MKTSSINHTQRYMIAGALFALCVMVAGGVRAQDRRSGGSSSRSSSSSSSSRSSGSSSSSRSSGSSSSGSSSSSRSSSSSSSSRSNSSSSSSRSNSNGGERSWSRGDKQSGNRDRSRDNNSRSLIGNSDRVGNGDRNRGGDRDRKRHRDRDGDRDFGRLNRGRDRDRDDRRRREFERGCYRYPTRVYQSSNYGYYRYSSNAYEQGYQDGLLTGASDARRGQSYDPERSHFYRHGAGGFLSIFGSPASYSMAYRDGFLRGYEEGYQNYQNYFLGGRFHR